MYKTFLALAKDTQKGAALLQLAQSAAGSDEFGEIVYSGASVDGDTFTLDVGSWTGRAKYEFNTDVTSQYARKFWVKLLGASALTLGDTSLNNTAAGKVTGVTITAHGFTRGYVFGVGTEFFRVVNVRDANTVDVVRGYAGSTVAAHASAAAVLTLANYTGINLLTDTVLPVTALAIATSGPQIATAMNSLDGFNPKDYSSPASGILPQTSLGFGFTWEYISATTRLFFHRPCRGNASGATTVTLSATITNGVMSTALMGGVQVAEVKFSVESRVPTAAEVTAGYMDFAFGFPVQSVTVVGLVTATRAAATLGMTISYSADFKRVTLTNNGINNFAATQTITVKVTG